MFIHGGSFTSGGADFYTGDILSGNDLIFIAIQYRFSSYTCHVRDSTIIIITAIIITTTIITTITYHPYDYLSLFTTIILIIATLTLLPHHNN